MHNDDTDPMYDLKGKHYVDPDDDSGIEWLLLVPAVFVVILLFLCVNT